MHSLSHLLSAIPLTEFKTIPEEEETRSRLVEHQGCTARPCSPTVNDRQYLWAAD